MRTYIWWFGLNLNPSTTVIMPSEARITQGKEGVFISYSDGVKRWISNTFFEDVNTDYL